MRCLVAVVDVFCICVVRYLIMVVLLVCVVRLGFLIFLVQVDIRVLYEPKFALRAPCACPSRHFWATGPLGEEPNPGN